MTDVAKYPIILEQVTYDTGNPQTESPVTTTIPFF